MCIRSDERLHAHCMTNSTTVSEPRRPPRASNRLFDSRKFPGFDPPPALDTGGTAPGSVDHSPSAHRAHRTHSHPATTFPELWFFDRSTYMRVPALRPRKDPAHGLLRLRVGVGCHLLPSSPKPRAAPRHERLQTPSRNIWTKPDQLCIPIAGSGVARCHGCGHSAPREPSERGAGTRGSHISTLVNGFESEGRRGRVDAHGQRRVVSVRQSVRCPLRLSVSAITHCSISEQVEEVRGPTSLLLSFGCSAL